MGTDKKRTRLDMPIRDLFGMPKKTKSVTVTELTRKRANTGVTTGSGYNWICLKRGKRTQWKWTYNDITMAKMVILVILEMTKKEVKYD
jgi:hypothetical protein